MRSFIIIASVLAIVATTATAKPLDDYVHSYDPAFEWRDTGLSAAGVGCTFYILNMTSQSWLTPNDWHFPTGARGSGSNKWQHYVLVAIPTTITQPNKAFLYVTGGNNDFTLPSFTGTEAQLLTAWAVQLGMVGAAVFQVPNQPIIFSSDPLAASRTEDAILAFSWDRYLSNLNPEWVARLPMTKAAVKAIDATVEFAKLKTGNNIRKYVVSGASKRGWVAWLVAATDSRVIGTIPMVMDELNFKPNIKHHYRAYGGWTFALYDYWVLNLTTKFDDVNFAKLMEIEDPLSYEDRLTMPKLVVDAGNDEFFLPDDQLFWWDDMANKKYSLMLPNVGHSLAQQLTNIVAAGQTFISSIVNNTPRPRYTFYHDEDEGSIQVTSHDSPIQVNLWYAFSAAGTGRRDFRQAAGFPVIAPQSAPWSSIALSPVNSAGTRWRATAPTPPTGQWTAYFIELLFTAPSPLTPYRFTTTAAVFPNTYVAPECFGSGCYGVLL